MMFNYPYFGPPFYRRYPYRYYNKNVKEQCSKQNNTTFKEEPKKEEKTKASDDIQYLEVFGIKLYYDDILIICLLYFLYNEGVKDQGLFISLIMLLLT